MPAARAIIADDERHVRDELVRMLGQLWPELEITAVADNGAQAAALLQGLSPDVAFLDIRMPLQSGMDIAGLTPPGCQLVFVTAYDEYAVQAFEHHAVDYLLKPVQLSRLHQTVARLKSGIKNRADTGMPYTAGTTHDTAPVTNDKLRWLRVSDGNAVVIVGTDQVVYFRAGDKYTTVVTKSHEYLIRKPLAELSMALDANDFWRIHRGVIINVRQIDKVRKGLNGNRIITLKERPEKLTASRRYRHLFEQM